MELAPLVIGIDPSLTGTGLAHVDGSTEVIDFTRGPLRLITGDHRLLAIANNLAAMLKSTKITPYAVIEDLPKQAKGAGLTGRVQGVVRLILIEHEIPFLAIVPSTLKMFATGKGTSPKPELRMALFKRTGVDIPDDNACDAWWLREIGLHKLGFPTIDLPKTHTRALDKVGDWIV